MVEAEPKQVVQRYLAEVLNGADPGRSRALISNRTFEERVSGFRSAFPDLSVETRLMLAKGGLVAIHAGARGTHEGLFYGCPPTGRTWTATCTAIYRIRDGRITDAWVNWDLLAILEQLGCVERAASVSA